jgi:CelD/BcsL family acetyltransferase involved in cellulose biosynthesis
MLRHADSRAEPVAARTPEPSVAGPQPEVRFEFVDTLESLREAWVGLADQGQNVFASWEFVATWWEHFGSGRRLLTAECRDPDGELFAILPLYQWRRRPLRVIRFLGHGAGDVLGPVCGPARGQDAAQALRRLIETAPWAWDVFVGENLPGDQRWPDRLGGKLIRREGNPVLRETGDFEQFLAGRTPNFRRQFRRREQRLARSHRVRYRLSDRTTLDADLGHLFRLHAARFGARSVFADRPRAAFHRAFAHRALERGWLRLWLLELDDRPRAALYGFRFGGVESFYQSGRDPDLEHESLGMALLTHAIRSALDDQIPELNFLRGHEPYKYRFATDDRGLESVCVTRGPAAAAALALVQAARSSRAARKVLHQPFEM